MCRSRSGREEGAHEGQAEMTEDRQQETGEGRMRERDRERGERETFREDMSVSDALQLARQVDPQGLRSIGRLRVALNTCLHDVGRLWA